jgi:hypothetical protein
MKKFTMIILLACIAGFGFSQSNIPNGNLEDWYHVNGTNEGYDQPGTALIINWLSTLNELASYPFPLVGPVTAFKTTDKYAGNYAIKLVTDTFHLGYATIVIPGMIGTSTILSDQNKAVLGRYCEGCRPRTFTGWYKYEPVSNDSCTAVILLSKWNAANHKRDTIGFGKMIDKNIVDVYTQFNVAIDYRSAESPDTMTLLVIASAGFNVIDFLASQGQVGSTMFVDDLMLEYPAGIQVPLMPEVSVNVYPNPATNLLTVALSEMVENGSLVIMTSEGKQVSSLTPGQKKTTVPVGHLAAGNYFISLYSGKRVVNTVPFIIQK